MRRPRTLPSIRSSLLCPSAAEVGSIKSRAVARFLAEMSRKRIQMIIECNECDPKLKTAIDLSTCSVDRQYYPDGTLFELVSLNGRTSEISDRDLAAWIETFPIRSAEVQS